MFRECLRPLRAPLKPATLDGVLDRLAGLFQLVGRFGERVRQLRISTEIQLQLIRVVHIAFAACAVETLQQFLDLRILRAELRVLLLQLVLLLRERLEQRLKEGVAAGEILR